MVSDWLFRIRALLRRGRVEEELHDEVEFHVARQIERLVEGGLTLDEARRRARLEFGGIEQIKEECRDARGVAAIEQWGNDLRHAVRSLARVPVMAASIVLTVGVGLGATTVMFGAVDAALLRPLPYRDPGRLVRIYIDSPPNKFRFSAVDVLALDAQQRQFRAVAAYTDRTMAFSDGTQAERVRGKAVSWNYFAMLGIRPALGRDFTQADGRLGAAKAVMVSSEFWSRYLAGRSDAIGRPVRLDGQDYELAGVLPSTVGPLEQRQDFFVPLQLETPRRKGPFLFTVVGRLRPDGPRALAENELRTISRRIFPLWRASYQDEKASWAMVDLRQYVSGDVAPIAGLTFAAVALVWLISCANASSLLVARVTSRRRELALRTALGATRGRVVQHLVAESAVLAGAAAAVGATLAWGGMWLLRHVGATAFPRSQEIALNTMSLGVLVALTTASFILFGVIPALQGARRASFGDVLRSQGHGLTGGVSERRLRRLLVGTQFAITTPLLVAAVLLLATVNQLGRVEVGFDTRKLLTAGLTLPRSQYPDPSRVVRFWDELQRRVDSVPGVTSTAFADGRPPNDVGNYNNFDLEAFPTPVSGSQPVTPWVAVSPEYFRTLGLTLLQGRLFDDRDGRTEALDSVVVDRAWAARFFPHQPAVGQRFREGGCTTCPWTAVVGVVSDVKYAGLDKPDAGTVYTPMEARLSSPTEQMLTRSRYLIIRTRVDPFIVLPEFTHIVRGLDPSLPLVNVATADELLDQSLQRPRSLSLFVTAFAIVALVLSVIGIYGVMAYYVQQHAKAISIRLALGGRPVQVITMIVRQGSGVVAGGVLAGLASALVMTRLMATLLFGVTADDPITYASVGIALTAAALLACYLPAYRAAHLDPSVALREE